jgi:hypothetical protein
VLFVEGRDRLRGLGGVAADEGEGGRALQQGRQRSSPTWSAAILVSRFLTMRKLASASRSFERSSAAWGTLMPR